MIVFAFAQSDEHRRVLSVRPVYEPRTGAGVPDPLAVRGGHRRERDDRDPSTIHIRRGKAAFLVVVTRAADVREWPVDG